MFYTQIILAEPSIFHVLQTNYRVSSEFGVTRNLLGYLKPKVHYGTDYAVTTGTNVYAVADGEM